MNVRFFLRHGAIVDWPIPDGQDFSLPALVTSIRAAGYFMAPSADCYIPGDEIGVIGLSGALTHITVPASSPPAPKTRQ